MLLSYVKIAFRSLVKNKIYSFINISGLTTGIAVSVLVLIFVVHEFSYDRFHLNGDRIFRVEKQFSRDGRHSLYANPQFGPEIKEVDTRVKNYVRMFAAGRRVIKSDPQHRFFEERLFFSDTSFFSIFSFPLIRGQREMLAKPSTVIITEKMAAKYFGNIDAVGKTITFDKDYVLQIVGIAKNPPTNSSLQFDFVASFSTLLLMPSERNAVLNNSSGFPTYLLLEKSRDLPFVQRSISKTSYTNSGVVYSLAPLFANHFNLNFGDTSNIRYVFIFLCASLLILAMALINYMNLVTARATTRAKETGIRKVIGATRRALSVQFYIESGITITISFLLALILVQMFKPLFLEVIQQQVDTSFMTSPLFVSVIVALLCTSILISGSYPALVLPRFKPVDVLNGKFGARGQGAWLRKGLTVFQFGAAVGLTICTGVMDLQLDFLRSKDIGLKREQVMVVPISNLSASSIRSLRAELRQQSDVKAAAVASVQMFKTSMSGLALVKSPVSGDQVGTKWVVAGEGFLDVLGIPWAEKPESNIIGNHVINEAAADAFGMVEKRTGYDLNMGGDHVPVFSGKIVGVVKDFNYETLRARIEPLILTVVPDTASNIAGNGSLYIRLDPRSKLTEKITSIGKIYRKYSGETPFSYYFLDDAFSELQKGEQHLSKVFSVFTLIALCIASLGLFGLITFTIESRTKEISIRKVLGASIASISSLVSTDLVVLIVISILIGTPVALIVMSDWLNHFFYQTTIPTWLICIPAVSIMAISLLIISTQAAKVANENPARNLNNE